MTYITTHFRRHRLITAIIIAVVVALGIGGYAITNSGSSKYVSGSSNAAKATAVSHTPAVATDTSNGLGTAKVIPFQQGAPSPATPVGQIPAGFSDGDGTLVTGTTADQATAAAAAAFPGGTINRVSVLSDGEYNVHVIGVNWPHHVFVSQDFKVVGAE